MNEFEKSECSMLSDEVTAYAWGGRGDELRALVEAHLNECPSCRQFVSFVQEFIATARENRAGPDALPGPHPDASLIVDLEADTLDEQTAQKVGLHLLECKSCRDAYLRLRSLTDSQFEERILAEDVELTPRQQLERTIKSVMNRAKTDDVRAALSGPEKIAEIFPEKRKEPQVKKYRPAWYLDFEQARAHWRKLLDEEPDSVIELGKVYGVGTIRGLSRIAGEIPSPANISAGNWKSVLDAILSRGLLAEEVQEGAPEEISKVVQIPVGENTYQVKLGVNSDGWYFCDITGLHTPFRTSLGVVLYVIKGDISDTDVWGRHFEDTDDSGNAYVRSHQSISGGVSSLLLTLGYRGNERSICFTIPRDFISPSPDHLLTQIIAVSSPEEVDEYLKRKQKTIEFVRRKLRQELPDSVGAKD